jgi:hypothetical protein
MSSTVFFMILGAALVHAWWNALVKGEGDRATLLKTMSLTQLACSVCLIPFVDERTIEATWRRIGALLDCFSPAECANYLKNSGYAAA